MTRTTLEDALRYPWNSGEAGTTLVLGGVLTLLSPLVIPAFAVLGYGLRVVEAVLEEEDAPPAFGDPVATLVDGAKAAVVLAAYVVVPLAVGTVVVAGVAGQVGFRMAGGIPSFERALAVGGVTLVVVLLLAGLALVVAYVAPTALVHLARTRRLRAAFVLDDVRELARADAYGSAWLLALAVFASSGVVLAVLNLASIGVVASGFVTFYAFVAMAFLYARGAREVGFAVEPAVDPAEGDVAEPAGGAEDEAATG